MAQERSVTRIETNRVLLRVWTLADVPLLKRAYDESGDSPARASAESSNDSTSLETVTARVSRLLEAAARGEKVPYAVFDRATGVLVATAGLIARFGPGGLEIGYWVHGAWRRKGIATETSAALTRAAFEVLGVPFIEIRCAKANVASAGVPRALGYHLEATLPRRVPLPGGAFDDSLIFALHAEDYPRSAAAKYDVSAYGADGSRLL